LAAYETFLHIHRRGAEDRENSTFSLAGDTAKEKPTYHLVKIKSGSAAGRQVFKNRYLPIFEKNASAPSVPLR
jgi:hypothetical protein